MIRGTTPMFEFEIPFDVNEIEQVCIAFSQNDNVIIEKMLKDCNIKDKTICVKLTQEETLKLECDCITEIQLRVRTKMDDILASQIFRVSTDRILKDGVV